MRDPQLDDDWGYHHDLGNLKEVWQAVLVMSLASYFRCPWLSPKLNIESTLMLYSIGQSFPWSNRSFFLVDSLENAIRTNTTFQKSWS